VFEKIFRKENDEDDDDGDESDKNGEMKFF
jgi:hypothetical protein